MMDSEIVVIESGKGRSKFDILDEALVKAQFERSINGVWEESGKSKSDFLVVVKPNLAMFFGDKITITDPSLVEHLIDRIHDLGYKNVFLGEAQNAFSKWLENREIHTIARAAGYRLVTPKKRGYKVVDLADHAVPCDFPPVYSLSAVPICKLWQDADFRVSFAKNKTHEQYMYTLCLKNLLGAIALDDKHFHFHSRLKVWDVCLELYQHFPVHFNIIDAYESSHGNTGAQMQNLLRTETIIAGSNAILVDWAGATKMGLDPYACPLNRKALTCVGLPENIQINGSLAPYEGWENVHPLISKAYFSLDEADTLRRYLWPASFSNDSRLFPWKTKLYEWINKIISPFWKAIDRSSTILYLFISILYAFVFFFYLTRVWRVLFNKKRLKRKELPINLPVDRYEKRHYDSLPDALRMMAETIYTIPLKRGCRHTFLKEGVLFYLQKDIDVPYSEFVNKMHITEAVTRMRQCIGGRTVSVAFDDNDRCIHQLERTVFLPQPNFLVILNAKDIDVTKLEHIEYGLGFQRITWLTVLSDNDSATDDEGTVTFEECGYGTRVKIMVHQRFRFPGVVELIFRFAPGLRRGIVPRVYRYYFTKTVNNYHDVAQGRYQSVGRCWVAGADLPQLT